MNESKFENRDEKAVNKESKRSASKIIKPTLFIIAFFIVSALLVNALAPKSLIADILGGKSRVEYSFQGLVQVAVKDKTVVDYNPVTGEAKGNHTEYTYDDCLWFKSDDKSYSPNYMMVPDYLLEKDRASAMAALKEIADRGESFEVYQYDNAVSHIVYYNVNGYRMKCVPPIHGEYKIKRT